MAELNSIHTLSGTRWLTTKTYKGFGIYSIICDQVWSASLTVRRIEKGIYLWGYMLGLSKSKNIWTDGGVKIDNDKAYSE